MGFNTRYIDIEKILHFLDEKEPLSKLFSADAFIFLDELSSKVYVAFSNGESDYEIEKIVKNGKD